MCRAPGVTAAAKRTPKEKGKEEERRDREGEREGGVESRLCRIRTAAPRNFFRGCHLHLACAFCPDEVVSLSLVPALSRRPLLLKVGGKKKGH